MDPQITEHIPEGNWLNSSVYELYHPKEEPSMQVVLFHGFQLEDYDHAHVGTWKSRDGSVVWPTTWLVEKFPKAQVLSVSYNGWMTNAREGGKMDLYNICENLISDFGDAKIGENPGCPIILVGHSFGGLVIKHLCVHVAHNISVVHNSSQKHRLENFLKRCVRGIFFYSTPHHGIRESARNAFAGGNPPLLKYVEILSTPAARDEFDFSSLSKKHRWQIAGLGENLPIRKSEFCDLIVRKKDIVVPEGAARYGSVFNIAEGTDHITITRPKDKTERCFTALMSFLSNVDSEILKQPQNYQRTQSVSVGIEVALEDVKKRLKSKWKTLALVGMGGIGKTTLAQELFNAVGHLYTCTCFVHNVKKIEGSLEDAILNHMHLGGHRISEDDRKKGLSFLTKKSLLLVLDNVDSKALEIAKDIAQRVDEKSRFVTTTRNKGICSFESDSDPVYDVPFLPQPASEDLFCEHALKGNLHPPMEYTHIVNKCGGLPLALEVIGKFIFKNKMKKAIWKNTLQALDRAYAGSNIIEQDLWAVLRISYDGLDCKEKNVFLDAATVFYECELSVAQTAWNSTTKEQADLMWNNLMDLSLVKEDFDGEQTTVGMHDQLLTLGRRIDLEKNENNGLRIWNDTESAKDLLSNKKNNAAKDIVALKYCGSELNMPNFDSSESNTQNLDTPESDIQSIEAPLLHSLQMNGTGGGWLNSSVYQLHLPRKRSMQVVFFHGFQLQDYEQAHVNTWKSRDGSAVWPATWLVEKFPEAQVLSFSFNKWMTSTLGNIDPFNMCENSMADLLAQVLSICSNRPITTDGLLSDLLSANIGEDRSCPVILVGHGFGASVIEELCLHVKRQINVVNDPRKSILKNFMESVRGIFFYAPIPFPISETVRGLIAAGNLSLSEYVATLSIRAASVELDFSSLTEEYRWHGEVLGAEDQFKYEVAHGKREIRALQEGRPFSLKHIKIQYTRYAWGFILQDDADHITITRPTTRSDKSFTALMDFLSKIKSEGTSSTPNNRVSILGTQLCKMEKLQYLWLEGVDVDPETQDFALPQTLVYLHLCNVNWSAFLWNPLPKSLVILRLRNLRGLQTLPPSIGNLSSLQILNIESNDDLENLSDSFGNDLLGNLQKLRNIRIKGCKILKELPGSFLRLGKLEQIELLEIYLKTIPDLKTLRLLKTLVVSWAKTVRFPTLPRCLQSRITELNYSYLLFTLDVVGGEFRERYSNSNIVGIYPILQSLEAKLLDKTTPRAKHLAVVGMPGIGKTTLARELFQVLGWRYSYTCFLDNVKSISGSLEEALVRQMRHDQVEISEEERRSGLGFLNGEQLLLVLDDVDHKDELQRVSNLLSSIARVHEDSRFIVTCVDWDFSNFEKFHVQPLLRNNSIELFNVHAFKDGDPSSLGRYAHEILRKCGGIPFNLEVIGKYLNNKPKSTWDSICLALV